MRSSGVHTPSSCPAHSSFASARASRRSVFARAWRMPVSLGETTITRATCGSRIRAIAHALPVTSNATWSRASRLCAKSSSACGVVAIRPAERSRPSATIATSQKSRWTSSATALTSPPHCRLSTLENWWANDIDGSALAAQPGKSQGRPLKSPGSKAHRPKRPAQPALSQKAPRPSQPNLSPPPDTTGTVKEQFHAPTSGSTGVALWAALRTLGLPRLPAAPQARPGAGSASSSTCGVGYRLVDGPPHQQEEPWSRASAA
jgi:hypothetical protein